MSTWVLAFTVETLCVYFFTYLLKEHPSWWRDFTAVYYSLRMDDYVLPLGAWMRQYSSVERFATIFTIYTEAFAPWVLLLSWVAGARWWVLKMLVIALFWGLHVGILLTLQVGIFSFYCLIVWTIFIPGEVWERVDGLFGRNALAIRLRRLFGSRFIGEDGGCLQRAPGIYFHRFTQAAGAFMVVAIIVWNISTIKKLHFDPGPFGTVRHYLHLATKWAMFSPAPRHYNLWMEVTGKLDDGTRIDLLSGSRNLKKFRKDAYLAKNARIQKLRQAIAGNLRFAPVYADYHCRKWNKTGENWDENRQLISVKIAAFYQANLPDDERGRIIDIYNFKHKCGDPLKVFTKEEVAKLTRNILSETPEHNPDSKSNNQESSHP
jgi:hypothetical protein